jgi:hypothetical protein
MKVQVKVHVFMSHAWAANYMGKEWHPDIWGCKVDEAPDRVYIGEQAIEVDIPDDFNPVPAQVRALEELKAEEVKKHVIRMAEINEQLSKLLCITNDAVAA